MVHEFFLQNVWLRAVMVYSTGLGVMFLEGGYAVYRDSHNALSVPAFWRMALTTSTVTVVGTIAQFFVR